MTEDHADDSGKPTPANGYRAPGGQGAASENAAFERRDAVVLSIARLIGRQLAREHFETLKAANDSTLSHDQEDTKDGSSDPDDPETPPEC